MRHSPSKDAAYNTVLRFDQLAHDLKDPIVVIANTLEQCSWRHSGKQANNHLKTIQREIDWMVTFTDHLLELTRYEAGKTQLRRHLVFLDDLLHETVEELAIAPGGYGCRIRVLPSLASDVAMMADEGQVHRLLFLLLSSASKVATSPVDAEVKVSSDASRLVVEMRANGLPGAWQFNDFSSRARAAWDRHDARQRGITGLEFSIARWIAQAHGGSLTILDKPRKALLQASFSLV